MKQNNIFYGINVIKNLIIYKFNYIKFICMLKDRKDIRFNIIKNIAKKFFIKINFVNKNYFNFISYKYNHQGIIAYTRSYMFNFKYKNFIDYLKSQKKNKKSIKILILDRINNPYNLGSCIRTAVGIGINIIIISKKYSVSIYNNLVHKTSSGAIYKILILECNNILNILSVLKLYDFYIIGTCLKSHNYLYNNKFIKKYTNIVILLGSENKGIKNNIKNQCDLLLKIPIKTINSFNVSVANGIILYTLFNDTL